MTPHATPVHPSLSLSLALKAWIVFRELDWFLMIKARTVCSSSQMFLHTARARGGGGAAGMEEAGLGLFDAFFASLSMIIVSEVSRDATPVFVNLLSCLCMHVSICVLIGCCVFMSC